MSDSDDIEKPVTKKKKGNGTLFRRQRTFSRKRAMQFIYRLDVCQDWTIRPEELEYFKGTLDDLEEDSETLDRDARKPAYEYMEDIIRGVREHLDEIDRLIRSAAKNWRLERMGPVERCLLRVAVFEMIYVKRVSAAIAINEAIELSKSFGQGDTPRFVNGVLERIRQLLEDPKQRAAAAKQVDEAEAERQERLRKRKQEQEEAQRNETAEETAFDAEEAETPEETAFDAEMTETAEDVQVDVKESTETEEEEEGQQEKVTAPSEEAPSKEEN